MKKNQTIATVVLTAVGLSGVGAVTAFAADSQGKSAHFYTVNKNEVKDNRKDFEKNHEAHLSSLAKELGVSEEVLKNALDSLKPSSKDLPKMDKNTGRGPSEAERAKHDAELAKALGVSSDKFKSAVESLRSSNTPPSPSALAKALGLDEAKVKSVLDSMRKNHSPKDVGEHRGDKDKEFAKKLASVLKLDEAKVEKALEKNKPADRFGERGPKRGGGFGERDSSRAPSDLPPM